MPFTEEQIGFLEDSESSFDGAEHATSLASSLRQRLLDLVIQRGSITADEFAQLVGVDKGSTSPRFAELEKQGLICRHRNEAGKHIKRKSSTGVQVCVYYPAPRSQ